MLLVSQPPGLLLLTLREGGLALGPQQPLVLGGPKGGPVRGAPARGTEPSASFAAGRLPGGVLLLAPREDLRPLRGPAAPLLPQGAVRRAACSAVSWP